MSPSDVKGNALKDKNLIANGPGNVFPTKQEPKSVSDPPALGHGGGENGHGQTVDNGNKNENVNGMNVTTTTTTSTNRHAQSPKPGDQAIEDDQKVSFDEDTDMNESQVDSSSAAATPTDVDQERDQGSSTEDPEPDQGDDGEEAEEGEFTDEGDDMNTSPHQGQADGLDLLATAEAEISLAENGGRVQEDTPMVDSEQVGTPTEQSVMSEAESMPERTDGSDDEDENDEEEEEEEDKTADNDEQEEDEDENEDEDETETLPAVVDFKKPSLLSQKPTLNRPQPIEEEKDSGDDLSDLSEFDDTDSDEDDGAKVPVETSIAPKTLNASQANTRPSLTQRRKSLRGSSRERREQEQGRAAQARQEEEDDGDSSTNERPPPRRASLSQRHRRLSEIQREKAEPDSGSEVTEGDDREGTVEENEGDEEEDEEQDAEVRVRQRQALDALSNIEEEFANLRERMYEERMRELDKEVEMIHEGTHPELASLMREIEGKRHQRLRVAKAWRTHMGEIAQYEFEITEYQAHCTYQSKRRNVRTDLASDLGRKQRKLIVELTLASDSRRKNAVTAEKQTLVRARKQRKYEVQELRLMKERSGFPASTMPSMLTNQELEEDFQSMGLARPPAPSPLQPALQNFVDHSGGYQYSNLGRIGGPAHNFQRDGFAHDHRSH
ncbi:hypothetical protein BGZ83_001239, partial [Gryganskiella cystojenkinii]